MMKYLSTLLLTTVVIQTASAEPNPRRLECQIDEQEWCATIPKSAFSHINRTSDACIYVIKATVDSNSIGLQMTERTKDKNLNYMGRGPVISLRLQKWGSDAKGDYFGPKDRSFTLTVSKYDEEPVFRPVMLVRTPRTPKESYGSSLNCVEIMPDGNVRGGYWQPPGY